MHDDFDPDAPGHPGPESLFGLPHTPEEAALVVIPVPFEATTSYGRGTALAPDLVRVASAQVELNDPDTGEPWRQGIDIESVDPRIVAWNEEACALAIPVIEAGGAKTDAHQVAVARVNAIGDLLNDAVYKKTVDLFARGKIPAVLGGDHSVPFGAIRAAAERFPGVGLLHVDAHADFREAYEGFTWSHASIMHNVVERIDGLGHLVQVGLRDVSRGEAARLANYERITSLTDTEITWELGSGEPWQRLCARLLRNLPQQVWVTFDVDGLDPSLCPNTGTPVPGGLRWREVMQMFHELGERGHTIVGFDLCEVGNGRWDAIVGARLLYKLAGWALTTQKASGS